MKHPMVARIRRNWRGYSILLAAVYVLLIFTAGDFVTSTPILSVPLTLLGGAGIIGTVFAIWNPKKGKAK